MSGTVEQTAPAIEPPEPVSTADTAPALPRRPRKRVRRRPIKKCTIWLHRWLSLVLGLFLVVECTTGAILVYEPELQRFIHRDELVQDDVDPVGPDAVSYQDAIDAVVTADPEFVPGYVFPDGNTIVVNNADTGAAVTVDPRNGEVIGGWSEDRPNGFLPWVLALSENVHLCAFSCEGDPLYASWLADEIPHSEWLGFSFDGEDFKVTYAGLVLGVLGLLLVFLSLSGIWLWWPTVRHFRRGVRVRFRGNRYARDYDLHQVVGMIGLPLLLVWGLTGVSYEFGFVEKAWYGALPGEEIKYAFVSEGEGPDITYDEAVDAAQEAVGTTARPIYYGAPYPDDPAAAYDIWFSDGYDPWYGAKSGGGDLEVYVDRHDASRTMVAWGSEDESLAQHLYQDYNYPVHAGSAVNAWWRIIWVVLGLTPLLLMWTGISTWLLKRATRKRRRDADVAKQEREAEQAGEAETAAVVTGNQS